jgi:hypothetical protein
MHNDAITPLSFDQILGLLEITFVGLVGLRMITCIYRRGGGEVLLGGGVLLGQVMLSGGYRS